MWNPFLPAVGIMSSSITLGYMDLEVWATFFIIVLAIVASYFIYVIPRKYEQNNKRKQ
jgi:hypothetical protein